jgi:Superinfection immunity protein
MSEFEGQMNELRTKWGQLESPVRFAVIAAAVVIGVIVIVKILPALVAAMGIGLLLVLLFVPYWLPTIIAFVRHQPSRGGILALNLFLGWTFIGWVLALVWSLSDNSARGGHTVIVHTAPPATSTAGGTPPPPQHQVGDVVNGHRFDGSTWVPLQTPPAPPAPPSPPIVGSEQTDV